MKICLYESEIGFAVKYVKEHNPYSKDWSDQYIRDSIHSLALSLMANEYESIESMGVLLKKDECFDDDIVNVRLYLSTFCDDRTKELYISSPETD